MSDDPKSYNFPKGKLLRDEQLDNLARAMLSLTREICVLTDRQMVTEKILAQHGMDIAEEIDLYQPDEATQAHINARIELITKTVINNLSGDTSE